MVEKLKLIYASFGIRNEELSQE